MRRIWAIAVVLAFAGIFLSSCCTTNTCTKKKAVPGYVQNSGRQGIEVAPTPKGSEAQVVEAPKGKTPYQLSQEELERQRLEAERRRLEAQRAKEAEAMAQEEQQRRLLDMVHKDIHFEFDSYTLSEEAKEILGAVAEYLHQHPNLTIRIEGNCDERGSTRYNLALGEKRANAAKEYLGYLGIDASRIDTVSYGEEKPLCTEHTEECWAKNRRDHIVVIGE